MNCGKTHLFISIIILLFLCFSAADAQDKDQNNFNKAKLLFTEGEFSRSLDILKKLRESEPENVNILLYLGLNYQSQSKFGEASGVLEKALELDPGNIKLMNMLGNNYYSSGRIGDADSVLTDAFNADSTDMNILLSLGQVFKKEQSWSRAKNIYRTLIKQDPTNSFYYEQFAYCCVDLKDTDNAVINFQIAHRLNPLNQNTVIDLSQLYFSQQKLISALRIIDDGLRVYPFSTVMWTKKGDINLKMKNYNDAISGYQYSIILGDSSEINFRNMGISYYWIGKYDSSVSVLNRSIKIMEKDPTAYFYLGASYKGLKQYNLAVENLLKAVKLQRNDFLAETLIQIGATYYEQKDYSSALKFYQDALREKPDKNEIIFYLAAVYDHYYKDKTVAINYYKKFLSGAEDKTDETLLKYAKNRITSLIEENHFRKGGSSK